MKVLSILSVLMAITTTQLAFAVGYEGFANPTSAVTALLKPLNKGLSGVSESVKALPGEKSTDNALIDKAKETNPTRPLEESLNSIMAKGGKLLYYRKSNEEVKLGGKMVKQFYDLYFQNGGKRTAMIVVFQPTLSGGYHIMDVQIDDQVKSDTGLVE